MTGNVTCVEKRVLESQPRIVVFRFGRIIQHQRNIISDCNIKGPVSTVCLFSSEKHFRLVIRRVVGSNIA